MGTIATIASLDVALSANSASLKRDLNKASKSTKTFARNAKADADRAGKAFKNMGIIITGLAATASIMVIRAADTARSISVLSTAANTSVRDFQALAFATQTVGLEQEKLGDMFRDVNDKVGDFISTGAGPLKDFFEQIGSKVGITIDDFRNLSGPQALGLYAKTLQDANVSQQETIFYMEALASDASLLTPLLANNGAQLDALTGQYNSLNIALSETEVENLTGAGDALRTLGDVIVGLANKFAAALAPAVMDVSNAFIQFAQDIDLAGILQTIADNIDKISGALAGMVVGLGVHYVGASVAATIATGGFTAALVTMRAALISTGVGALVVALGAVAGWMLAARDNTGEFEDGVYWAEGAQRNLNTALDTFNSGAETAGGQAIALAKNMMEEAKAANLAAKANYELAKARVASALADTGQGRNNTERRNIQRYRDEAATLSEEYDRSVTRLTQSIAQLESVQTNVASGPDNPTAERFTVTPRATGTGGSTGPASTSGGVDPEIVALMDKIIPQTTETVSTSFMDSMKIGLSAAFVSGDWKGFANETFNTFSMGVIDSITGGLMDGLFGNAFDDVFKQFGDFISGALGEIMSGLSGSGGAGGGLFGAVAGLFMASGGIVPHTPYSRSGQDSVPAMLMPGELVVPVGEVGNYMNRGGGQVINNINITGDISRQTKKEILRMMPQIAAGVNSNNREGGR